MVACHFQLIQHYFPFLFLFVLKSEALNIHMIKQILHKVSVFQFLCLTFWCCKPITADMILKKNPQQWKENKWIPLEDTQINRTRMKARCPMWQTEQFNEGKQFRNRAHMPKKSSTGLQWWCYSYIIWECLTVMQYNWRNKFWHYFKTLTVLYHLYYLVLTNTARGFNHNGVKLKDLLQFLII